MCRFSIVIAAACLSLLAGCTRQSQHAHLGRQFLLAEEPAGAQGIIDFHETVGWDKASSEVDGPPTNDSPVVQPQPVEVTLVGRVGFKTLKWSAHSAMFLLTDPTEELDGGHVCHDENCPFCKGKNGPNLSQAIVMLVGGDGQVPPVDARKILPLEEGQTAVVSGRAERDEAGQLTLHARGIYIRR